MLIYTPFLGKGDKGMSPVRFPSRLKFLRAEPNGVRSIINNLYLSCLRLTLPLATLIVAPDSTLIVTLSSLMLSITP